MLVVVDEVELLLVVLNDIEATDLDTGLIVKPLAERVARVPEFGCVRVAEAQWLNAVLLKRGGLHSLSRQGWVILAEASRVSEVRGDRV